MTFYLESCNKLEVYEFGDLRTSVQTITNPGCTHTITNYARELSRIMDRQINFLQRILHLNRRLPLKLRILRPKGIQDKRNT